MQWYLDWSWRCWESIEKKPTSIDRPICWEVVKVKSRNLDKRGICWEAIEDAEKWFFKGEKHIRWESNKMATQTSIQATC